MSRMLDITVFGIPQQQGSKNAFVAGGRAIMADSNKNLKPWRTSIADEGGKLMSRDEHLTLFDGPIRVEVNFAFPRPKGHYRSNGELKANAPMYHTSKPDADKLQRALGDALTGVVIRDDSRIVKWVVDKTYAERPHMRAIITEIREATDDRGTAVSAEQRPNPGGGSHVDPGAALREGGQ